MFGFLKKKKHHDYRETIDEELDEKEINTSTDKSEEDFYREHKEKVTFPYNIYLGEDDEKEKEIEPVRPELSPEELNKLIIEQILKVVDNQQSFEALQKSAEEAAKVIGRENVELLSTYIKDKVSKPSWLKGRFEELGQFPRAVENSVLSIIYSFNEYGVDTLLKEAAKGNSTSLKAINLLCKLAAKGVDRDKIVDSVIYIMKNLSDDDKDIVLGFLSQIKGHSRVERLFELYYKKFLVENDLSAAYEVALDLINIREHGNREQIIFIKALALYDGDLDISMILKDESGNIDFSEVDEELRTKAAISFYSINKTDKEINDRLYYLKNNSLDLELREYLTDILV